MKTDGKNEKILGEKSSKPLYFFAVYIIILYISITIPIFSVFKKKYENNGE